jgi:hypothetical protein
MAIDYGYRDCGTVCVRDLIAVNTKARTSYLVQIVRGPSIYPRCYLLVSS